jgi:hypothetical protein
MTVEGAKEYGLDLVEERPEVVLWGLGKKVDCSRKIIFVTRETTGCGVASSRVMNRKTGKENRRGLF